MAKATIRLYEKTGYNGVNKPYSDASLPAPSVTLADYLFLNSSQNVATLRLAGNYDWMKYDYISISGDTWGGYSTCYYWVTGYEILTNQEVEYTLAPDWETTVGGFGVIASAIERGMVSRIPVPDAAAIASTGGLNIIADNGFQPSKPLRILKQHETSDDFGTPVDDTPIIVMASTIDLSSTSRIAQTFKDSVNNLDVTVPTLPSVGENSIVIMDDMKFEQTGIGLYLYNIVATAGAHLKSNIEMIWGLNLQDAIKSVYSIPREYITYMNAQVTYWFPGGDMSETPRMDFNCPAKNVTISLSDIYNSNLDFVEKQAIAKFAYVYLASETSGENKTFELSNVTTILENGTNLALKIMADLSPGGKPYIKPANFEGKVNKYFKNTVAGTPWLSQPMTMLGASGAMVSTGMESLREAIEFQQGANDFVLGQAIRNNNFNTDLKNNYLSGLTSIGEAGLSGLEGILNPMVTGAFSKHPLLTEAKGALGISGVIDATANAALQQQILVNNKQNEDRNAVISRSVSTRNQAMANSYAQKEIGISNNLVAPTILFNRDPGIANYVKNGFYIGIVGLSQDDVDIFRDYMKFNGVAVCQPWKDTNTFTAPSNTNKYNYYKFDSIKFKKGSIPSIIANEIQASLYNGVRIC